MMMRKNVSFVNHLNWHKNLENLICQHHGNNFRISVMLIHQQKQLIHQIKRNNLYKTK